MTEVQDNEDVLSSILVNDNEYVTLIYSILDTAVRTLRNPMHAFGITVTQLDRKMLFINDEGLHVTLDPGCLCVMPLQELCFYILTELHKMTIPTMEARPDYSRVY